MAVAWSVMSALKYRIVIRMPHLAFLLGDKDAEQITREEATAYRDITFDRACDILDALGVLELFDPALPLASSEETDLGSGGGS